MKIKFLVLAACFSLFTAAHAAENSFQLQLSTQSRIWLQGDSTLHPYTSTATILNLLAVGPATDIETFQLTIPVEGLKSGEKGLDRNMYKALKSKIYPEILFTLNEKAIKDSSKGTLAIAGSSKTVVIEAKIEPVTEGTRISGVKDLLMTDYGIKPPSILGLVKTRNEVTIHFDLIVVEARGEKK